jgi:geranylgeranylglycerol-phosphate geranylgeranyltransferase
LGVPYLTVLIADAMFIYAAWIVFRNPHEAQKTAKIAMFAALVAFVLGALS